MAYQGAKPLALPISGRGYRTILAYSQKYISLYENKSMLESRPINTPFPDYTSASVRHLSWYQTPYSIWKCIANSRLHGLNRYLDETCLPVEPKTSRGMRKEVTICMHCHLQDAGSFPKWRQVHPELPVSVLDSPYPRLSVEAGQLHCIYNMIAKSSLKKKRREN